MRWWWWHIDRGRNNLSTKGPAVPRGAGDPNQGSTSPHSRSGILGGKGDSPRT